MSRASRAAGWGAAVWAGFFGVVHVYWIVGGRLGLGDVHAADEAFQRPWFVTFNVVTVLACAVAAGLALATVLAWGRHLPRRLLRVALIVTAALLLARGLLGFGQLLLNQQTAAEEGSPMLALYDPWFLLGGALFAWVAVAARRDRQEGPR